MDFGILFITLPILLSIGIFFLLRGLFLWYWKIDKIVEVLERIDDNTRKPVDEIVLKEKITKAPAYYTGVDAIGCPICDTKYPPNEIQCPKCGRANPNL